MLLTKACTKLKRLYMTMDFGTDFALIGLICDLPLTHLQLHVANSPSAPVIPSGFISRNHLITLLSLLNGSLEVLDMDVRAECGSSEVLEVIFSNCPSLRDLTIRTPMSLGGRFVADASGLLLATNLERLVLGTCIALSGAGEYLPRLTRSPYCLRHASFACSFFVPDGPVEFINCNVLESLTIEECLLDPVQISGCANLRAVEMGDGPGLEISDCPSLTSVIVKQPHGTDSGISIVNCPSLRNLRAANFPRSDLLSCNQLESLSLVTLDWTQYWSVSVVLPHLPNLQSLTLGHHSFIGVDLIIQSQKLQVLNLYKPLVCGSLSIQCPSLKELRILKTTSKYVTLKIPSCTNLEEVEFSGFRLKADLALVLTSTNPMLKIEKLMRMMTKVDRDIFKKEWRKQ